ncbi:MAG: inner-rane translocator [Lachnospiraceae bacterium]|jgi:ribose transport system permease protein|nr:inner-rane translocator [Lachnospiraceae bacterium]
MKEKITSQSRFMEAAKSYLKRNAGILIGLLAICIVISVKSPVFLTQKNILTVLRQISSNLFLASAMSMILIAGGIDLSVGSIIAFIGVSSGTLLNSGLPIPAVILICLIVGGLLGSVNGYIISRTTLPPFIVTFSMMSILRGLTYVYTGGTTVRIDDRSFINLGTGYLLGIPLPVIYMTIIVIIVFLILNKSKLGRHIYATGGNEKAAIFSGINVKNIRMFVYIFSGLMAALAGMVLAARNYSGNPLAGDGSEMDAIAACVLGGASMAGGYGFIGGTLIGALIIGLLNNGLNLMNIDSYWQIVLKGAVILIAVYVDYVKGLKKGKNKK